jgi:nitrous oxidase accessory protein
MHNIKVTALLLFILMSSSASPATLRVGRGKAFPTIGSAVKAAQGGDVVLVDSGIYKERVAITRPIVLRGVGKPIIDGQQKGTVVDVRSNHVTVEGFRVINSARSSLRDYCGIHVEDAAHVRILNNTLRSNQFSIMLQNTTDSEIRHNDVESDIRAMQVMGNAIHCWKCDHLQIYDNKVGHNRDGIYLEFVYNSDIGHNFVSGCERYGLHFMFSHYNKYHDNRFVGSRAGVAVMYTHDVEVYGNIFEQSRGGASYGLLLKEIQRGHIHNNKFLDNTVGILMDGGVEINLHNNLFHRNGWGLRVVASSANDTISHNNFIGNTFDVSTNGSYNSNVFDNNYWDKNDGYDLNKDGIADVPYHMLSLFSTLAERNRMLLLFFRSFLMTLMEQSEKLLPSITPDNYVDNMPSLKPFPV